MSGDRSARKAPSPVPDPRRKNRLVINEISSDSVHLANVFPTLTVPQNRRLPALPISLATVNLKSFLSVYHVEDTLP